MPIRLITKIFIAFLSGGTPFVQAMQKQPNICLICWVLNRDWSLADYIIAEKMADTAGIL